MAKRKRKNIVDVKNHVLIPKHKKLSEKDKKELFEKYNITLKELPKIPLDDPALADIDAKEGDVIKITRESLTTGKSIFYRGVISG
ncbi:DNA-directed RNA polymerase subunit H [Candidatus Woesearchaeota archaeon]|nr:DNA-directed RNA polymerase subunit H [Candidatus Woesearchaeota archaeon]